MALIWADGRLIGCRDREHHHLTLAMRGVTGEKYDVLIEVYAGHGPMVVGKGPVA